MQGYRTQQINRQKDTHKTRQIMQYEEEQNKNK